MQAFLSFEGRLSRLPYALAAPAAFLIPHLVMIAVAAIHRTPVQLEPSFIIWPLRSIGDLAGIGRFPTLLALAAMLLSAWSQAAMAFRRAADAGASGWLSALAVAPVTQIGTYLILVLLPGRSARPNREAERAPEEQAATPVHWSLAVQGFLVGVGVTIAAVVIAALVFGSYGYGIFVFAPFLVGAITGYVLNRRHDIGRGLTIDLVLTTAVLGGIGLVSFALEGLVCLVLAAPLALGLAAVGGVFGRAIARHRRHSAAHSAMSVALLPIVLAAEHALPPSTVFATAQTIEIAAAPHIVWHALVTLDMSGTEPELPFRLGMAYPLRTEIVGAGVGATRYGVFSTGNAVERITEWIPGERLAFVVLSDPPALHEMSPYHHVHAPHVTGYFRTLETRFELRPQPGGTTQVIEQTRHELRLDPVPYWLPMARWAVDRNNNCVLARLREQSEAGGSALAPR